MRLQRDPRCWEPKMKTSKIFNEEGTCLLHLVRNQCQNRTTKQRSLIAQLA